MTPEQLAVVEAERANLVVKAAAGSGKTRVLVERFLRLVLEKGIDADRILTVTFTRRAAAEMKRRIVSRLVGAGKYDQAQLAESGPISTIHGFCERLLRENAIPAGLDPEFRVVEGLERDRLLTRCVNDAMDQAEGDPNYGEILTLLAQNPQSLNENGPRSLLSEQVRSVLGSIRGAGITPDLLERSCADSEVWLASFWESCGFGDAKGDDFYRELAETQPRNRPEWARTAIDPQKAAGADWEAARNTCGVAKIVVAAWRLLESALRQKGWADFAFLESEALRVLEDSDVLCRRQREQYSAVLVDEAQDLNQVQYKLLGVLGCPEEMLVGDEQQSIYGFRQADKRLFQVHAIRHDAMPLSMNFRSTRGVLEYVDDVFTPIWTDRPRMATTPDTFDLDEDPVPRYEGVERIQLSRDDFHPLSLRIQAMLSDGETANQIAVLARTGFVALKVFHELRGAGIGCRLIGETEKYFTRLEIRDMANALAAVSDPSDRLSFLALLRSPLVGLSLDSVAQIALDGLGPDDWKEWVPIHPDDGVPWREFVDWFLPLRSFADRLPAWEVLSELIRVSRCLEKKGSDPNAPQVLANVRKLLRLASEVPELGPKEFANQIREIQTMRHPEGDAPTADEDADEVRIMTIHKAKGLEFPIVFLTGLESWRDPKVPLCVDPLAGRFAYCASGKASLAWRWIAQNVQNQSKDEELRVLYVALTRAERRLLICGDWRTQSTKFSMFSFLARSAATSQLPLWAEPDR